MVLELESVTKLYKNGRGVEDISFTLASGEVLGLLGPNGSGKTTTMKAIMGLVRPQAGAIRVCGADAINSREEALGHIGCLIEAPALYDYMTPEQNLRLAARFYADVDDARIDEVLYMVGMDRYKKDKVRNFSLGMRQRVGFAAALINKPRLLILDEPANALDIEGMMYVRDVIRAAAENGASVLVSSHLANEIQQCATKAAVIHSGRLLGMDAMDAILENHGGLEEFFLHHVSKFREIGGQVS
jgi:ABC-2 type transport system ATP-binding protein